MARIKINPLYLMYKTDASFDTFFHYLKHYSLKKRIVRTYQDERETFRKYKGSFRFSHDWFSKIIPFWLNSFKKLDFTPEKPLQVMEIGSFEGMSAIFVLEHFRNAQITCVDTWKGGDEHKNTDFVSAIEEKFDENVSQYSDRITKFKGTSFSYYQENGGKKEFDLIYIDGSHHVDDVMIDALKCFELLSAGGLMIFDDYLWCYYKNYRENPCAAINSFLGIKKDELQILQVGKQVHIMKKSGHK